MKVKLRELGEIVTGNTPSKQVTEFWDSDDICFVKPDTISDTGISTILSSVEHLAEAARSKARVVGNNAVLVTCIGSIGKIGITGHGEFAFNQQINAIIPNKRVNPKYLAYALLFAKPQLIAIANAPVVPIINKSQFGDFEINIAEGIQEQAEVSRILDKVVGVISKRQQQLSALDDLIKARFVEMFGAISETVPLSYYIESLTAGKSLAGEEECLNKVLKTGAATYDYFDPTQVKNLPTDYEPLPEHQVHDGDIIISRMNTAELVGAAAYVWEAPAQTYLPDRLWRAELREQVNPIFVWQAIVQPTAKDAIRKIAGGTSGSMKNISKPGLLSIHVKKASFEAQNEFAAFVTQIDKSKSVIQKSLDETQLLFDSLMQQYFK